MTVFDAEVEITLLKQVEEQADKAAAALRQVVGLLREVRDLGGALKTVRSDGKTENEETK